MKKQRKIKTINTHGVKGYSTKLLDKAAAREAHAARVKAARK